MGFGNFLSTGIDLLGGDTDGGGVGDVLGGFLGGNSSGGLGGIATSLFGDDIGGIVDNFAGSEGLGAMIGGLMQDDDGIGGALGGLLAGDSFGSPGAILGTATELAGDGPAWLQTVASVAEQLGEGNLSEVAGSVLGDAVDGSPELQFLVDSAGGAFGDSGLLGTALGELDDWGELAEGGLGALGVDLADVGGAAAALGSLTPESNENQPIAGFGDDLLGDEPLDVAAMPELAATGVPEPDFYVGFPLGGESSEMEEFDVASEPDPIAPLESDSDPIIDDGPVFDEPAPMDDLMEAVEAADELESSVDDLFEGLE